MKGKRVQLFTRVFSISHNFFKRLFVLGRENQELFCDSLTLFQMTNCWSFQIERGNGRKFSKWVENTVRKGEIARYQQFLLFPQCFQITWTIGLVWERVIVLKTGCSKLKVRAHVSIPYTSPLKAHYHTMPHFDALKIFGCRKNCEKTRNCLKQANSPLLTMFSTLYGTHFSF